MPRGDMDDVFCYTKIGFISVLCFIRKNVTGIIFMNKADPDTACKQKKEGKYHVKGKRHPVSEISCGGPGWEVPCEGAA